MSKRSYETDALQHEAEIAEFIALLNVEGVRSYLEIGSKYGGALWRVGNALPHGSRIVSVDLPWGDRSTEPHLKACIAALQHRGYDASLFLGDSTSAEIIDKVRALGPFDAIFIDANHTEPFVRKDWANYGPMGRIVAFHDIGWIPREESKGKLPIDVPKVWAEIKDAYRFREIRHDKRDNGIGVLWR